MSDKRFIIGIDLGTTNSAVSYVDLAAREAGTAGIKTFRIPQLSGPGEISRSSVLPSFLYIPGPYDVARESISVPWQSRTDNFAGAFARDHGAKIPARLVSSAKSWLCHPNADKQARILPWGAGEAVYKISPVQATAAFLAHIRQVWNSTKGDDDEQYLENQIVVITVPASFDEVARDLTVEAAAMAGLQKITLLEEPLAAFYSWLMRHEGDWAEHVRPGQLILVCDVGGGTTDFTLITLREAGGSPKFERIAVGDHLILGGDNMDLALARHLEVQLSQNQTALSTDRWKALCHQCRQAKEAILEGVAESRRITIVGEGRSLIGGAVSGTLSRRTVEAVVLDGFFPLTSARRLQNHGPQSGITEFGLPYEREPAITRHLGSFLEKHRPDVADVTGRQDCAPDLILFNGGALKPDIIQARIRTAVRHWFDHADSDFPGVLANPDPDLAVARGAAYYGLVKIGQGVRVGSGSARSFYLGIGQGSSGNLPEQQTHALCLVERGLDEGSRIEFRDRKFDVLANQPVSFSVYSSSFRSGDRCGDMVPLDASLTMLPPLQTIVRYGRKGVRKSLPVQIEAAYTEIGTLALWCKSLISRHRWRLQFQLRHDTGQAEVNDQTVLEESLVADACQILETAFAGPADASRRDTLVRDLTAVVERPKERWPLALLRKLGDTLLQMANVRKVSPGHEARWLNLTGFCLRPGFGDGFDEHRIEKLWRIHGQGPLHPKNPRVRVEWWIMWRRVGGGLKSGQQRQFSQTLAPVLMPKKKGRAKLPPQERMETWMALANLEWLLAKDKINWGRMLLGEIKPKKCKPQHLWALSRFGARELLYGPADRVVSAEEVAVWVEKLLSMHWRNPRPVGIALAQMGRKTGDRTRDLDPRTAENILNWLDGQENTATQKKFLQQVVPRAEQEDSAIFGESLPAGIVLRG